MEIDELPPNEVQQLNDIRKRFYEVLWNFSVVVDPETSQATSVASNADSQAAHAIFPYR
jgi:hypothetical protein